MAPEKKLVNAVTLFATIESKQHEALRTLAFSRRRSLADVVREALTEYLERQPEVGKPAGPSRDKGEAVHAR